jgi:hypothetical protein
MKKECKNCRKWGKQHLGKCEERADLTLHDTVCQKWEMSKLERIFPTYKSMKININHGVIRAYLGHWCGEGKSLQEAFADLEEKI